VFVRQQAARAAYILYSEHITQKYNNRIPSGVKQKFADIAETAVGDLDLRVKNAGEKLKELLVKKE
jgi:hypothetical protein